MKLIDAVDVSKKFDDGGKEIEALKKTNFSVSAGEFVAIIGPSGSGKSTLLTILGGLQTPTTGKVEIQEKEFSEVSDKKRTKLRFEEIGFILQASNLVPFLKVRDQLRLVNKVNGTKFDSEKNKELMDGLGIEELENKYPSDLSGGQRQRVAIARALYHDPSVILADEPTASLDTEKAFEVVEILARETKEKQKATIMVTHDERLISYCDRVYVMKDGVLSEREKAAEKE
ncbi:ABC transporter ATP-binding protein [Jeotgalibaca porci]|uniref:ABC transporter ATP-binding protein n=2 Tax=Jeotgalibaca porci TaxID=1868793 RepID=UPI0035A126E4